jgi:hypothetical protein
VVPVVVVPVALGSAIVKGETMSVLLGVPISLVTTMVQSAYVPNGSVLNVIVFGPVVDIVVELEQLPP